MAYRYSIDGDTLVIRGTASVEDESLLLPDGSYDVETLILKGMLTNNLLDESLIPSWNREKPRFKEYLRTIIDPLEDVKMLQESYLQAFDIDRAVGKQLDIIGSFVGAKRVLPFAPLSGSRVLSDDDYRLLIRSRIALNRWDGTTETAMDIFQIIYPDFGFVLKDNQNCTITVQISTTSAISDLQLEMLNAGMLLPRPAGVGMKVEVPQIILTSNVVIQSGVYELGQMDIRQKASF